MSGVKWDIDVEAKAGSAGAAAEKVGNLGRVLKKTESAAQANAREIKRLNFELARMHAPGAEEIAKLNKELGHLKSDHHSIFAEVFSAEIAKDALEKVLEKVIDIGREAIKSASAEQRMMRVFESHAGSKELGEQNELWNDILSKKTEFSEAQTEGSFIDLKTVGASDQEAKLAIKAAADIAAVSKNKDEAFGATIEAFSRLQRTGVISNRTLAPLGIGVKDFKTLDSMKGLSNKAIKKKMEEGKVDRNDLFKLIMSRAHETKIGQRAADNADLLGTKLSKLSELPDKFFKKLADTKAIKTLTTAIDGVLEKLDPDSPTGKRISGFLEGAFTAAANAISRIDFDSMADTLRDDVLPAIKAMADAIAPAVEAIGTTIKGLHLIADSAHSVASMAGLTKRSDSDSKFMQKVIGPAPTADSALGKFVYGLPFVGKRFKAIDDAAAAKAAGAATASGYAEGLMSKAPEIESAATQAMVETPKRSTESGLKIHSPSVVFADYGAMAAAGFISGIDSGIGEVDRSISRMFDVRSSGQARPAAGGRSGGLVIEQLVINVDGGKDGAEQGRRAADAFDARVRALWIGMLEQAKVEAGA